MALKSVSLFILIVTFDSSPCTTSTVEVVTITGLPIWLITETVLIPAKKSLPLMLYGSFSQAIAKKKQKNNTEYFIIWFFIFI